MNASTRFSLLMILQTLVIGLILFSLFRSPSLQQSLTPSQHRELANHLQAAGLLKEAIIHYERYLNTSFEREEKKASMALSLGELYESLGRWEKAINWYYRVELWDSQPKHKSQAAQKRVALLEKLGKVSAAKRELQKATSLNQNQSSQPSIKGALVLAKIGDKKIYLHDLDQAIDQLPPSLKENFKKEQKESLLKKLVADEVLSQKAIRLGLDQNPDLKANFKQIKRQLLIQKVLKLEIKDKIKIDESDLINYFKINQERYALKKKGKKKAKIPQYSKVKSQVENDYQKEKIQKRYQDLVEKSLAGEDIKIFVERVQ